MASSSPFPISSSSRVPRWGQSQALRPFGDSLAAPGPGHRAPRFCGVLARRGPAVLSARLSWPRRRPRWPPLAVSLPVIASAKESQPCSRPGSAPRVSKPPRRGDRDHRRGPAGVEQAPHPSCTSGAARNAGVTGWGASAAPAPSPEPGEPRPRHSGDGPGSKGGGTGTQPLAPSVSPRGLATAPKSQTRHSTCPQFPARGHQGLTGSGEPGLGPVNGAARGLGERLGPAGRCCQAGSGSGGVESTGGGRAVPRGSAGH